MRYHERGYSLTRTKVCWVYKEVGLVLMIYLVLINYSCMYLMFLSISFFAYLTEFYDSGVIKACDRAVDER